MRELRSEIDIDALVERVWQILTDFAAFPQWNPFMQRASGEPRPGEQLRVYIQPPGGRGMTFKPTVLNVEPNRELRWLGRLFLPGIFDGEHSLRLETINRDNTRFIQNEQCSGLLVPFLGGLLARTQRGFEKMNQALKVRAEAG